MNYSNCDMTEIGSAMNKHAGHSRTTARAGVVGLLNFCVSNNENIMGEARRYMAGMEEGIEVKYGEGMKNPQSIY